MHSLRQLVSFPVRILTGPFGGFLALSGVFVPSLFSGVVWWMAETQNDVAAELQRQQATTLPGFLQLQFDQHLLDYARWDEALQRLGGEPDADWFHANIGFETDGTALHDAVVVLTTQGEPVLGAWGAQPLSWDPRDVLGDAFDAWFADLARGAPDDTAIGFALIDGALAVVGLTALMGHSAALDEPHRYMLMVRHLTEAALADVRALTGIDDLTLVIGEAPARGETIVDFNGRGVAALAWQPDRPGDTAFARILPLLLAIVTLLVVANLALGRRGHQATERLAASEAQARHLAHHDSLTRLPNRRALQTALETMLQRTEPGRLLFIDLDGFKQVNDDLGHEIGDALLTEIAERLRRLVPADALLCRLGGDEFAILLRGKLADPAAIGKAVIEGVRRPLIVGRHAVAVSASVGHSELEPGITDHGEFMRRADLAMYAAKETGKNRVRAYCPKLDATRAQRVTLAAELRRGFDAGELWVAYQPIVDAASEEPVALEGLLRWDHPEHGPISPEVFVPVAEAFGLIAGLTEFVLRDACRVAQQWPQLTVSINLSPALLIDDGLPDRLTTLARLARVPPSRLELEVTEGLLLKDPARAGRLLTRLGRDGWRISLDDFGTGYASLGYLRSFPLDRIKLDRSFVQHIATDGQTRQICSAMIALARAMGKPVTAEGVETASQARLLSQAGCTHLQGYLFGRPQRLCALQASPPAARRPPDLACAAAG